ncbi:MAG: TrmH family RNA methyltransferase [Deltaproteobacteria bacterium]
MASPTARIVPSELLLERRLERIEEVVRGRTRALTVVLEGLHDPHNLAAILRTAEGLGLQDVHVVEGPAGFRPNPAVTQGADKWLTLTRHPNPAACVAALHARGYRVLASLLSDGALPLHDVPFTEQVALVFGNEHGGVSDEMARASDGHFRIPMAGFAQSFNVSVAAAIALWTGVDARRRAGLAGDLDPDEKAALRARFQALAVKQHKRLGLG